MTNDVMANEQKGCADEEEYAGGPMTGDVMTNDQKGDAPLPPAPIDDAQSAGPA